MKKILTVALSLCLLVALVASFAVSAAAEEVEVTVGSRFEWNEQKSQEEIVAWKRSKGKSADGLWKYQYYVTTTGKEKYYDLTALYQGQFAWRATPGDTGIGYARVRENGKNFHPATQADVVKTFICPSGGTITIDTTIARQQDWVSGKGTPTSLAIYAGDRLVFPTNGSPYETITSATETQYSVTDIEVSKNECVYIRIGCVDGDQGSDGVNMANFITYTKITDAEVDGITEEDVSSSTSTNTYDGSLKSDKDYGGGDSSDGADDEDDANGGAGANKGTNKGSNTEAESAEGGSNIGLIIAIVAGVVVVAGVAVAVVVIKKKN